jgi:hypothetical protein
VSAKRTTPNEEPALSLPKGRMQPAGVTNAADISIDPSARKTLQAAFSPTQLFVIPNRAPSPVRDLLPADTTTNVEPAHQTPAPESLP